MCRSSLKKFYKYQTIFYCRYNEQSKINAQYNSFNNLHDNKNKTEEIKNFTQEYKKDIINSNNYMITEKDIEKLHPNPVNDLTNIYKIVTKEFNEQYILYTYTKLAEMKTKCVIQVTWPYKTSFSSVASKKKTAAKNAALQCLNWLYEYKKIKGSKPILYDHQNENNLLNSQKYLSIDLTSDLKIEIKSLIDIFDKEMKSITTVPCTIKNNEDNLEKVVEADVNANSLDFNQMHYNQFRKNSKKRKDQNKDLPIINYKEEILNSLQNNQVLVIKGDTGCGKSTQIPQFILDAYKEHNKICECNIIVTEPRRISTISLAHRVAWERNENIGNTVGYHVRFEKKIPQVQYGSILYCTTGIFLQKLKYDRTLKKISHIIIDEAHDRSLQTDILLKLLKDILKHNSHKKLIIMSASINAEIFQQYFSSTLINIPGKLYDVDMHFIDDIHLFDDSLNLNDLMKTEIPFDKIVNLIIWIITNKPPGAILCFLPGWQEIKYLHDMLQNTEMKNLLILPLHSKIPNHIQKKAFKPAPNNFTKIILATDIAESGITIQDIKYVIDTAIKREVQWNEQKSLFNLNFSRISQANIFQRKGRAGRVQSGESYHLITRSEYNKLDLYPKPEILKLPLDEAIIISKTLSDEKIYDFFNSMIDSPNESTIISTVNTLKNLGILDDDENLTSLGKYVSYISLTPKLSKAIILSCIFQCLNPILLIATAFSTINHHVSLDQISNIHTISKKKKLEYHKTSDHIAVLKYLNDILKKDKDNSSFSFIYNYDKIIQTIKLIQQLCLIHINELINCKMIPSTFDFNYLNINAKNNELIRAILFAATNNLIKRNAYGYKKKYFTHQANVLTMENNKIVKIKNESVNYNRKEWPSDLLTYIDKMDYTTRYSCMISDTSMISPLSVLLFSQNDVQCEKIQNEVSTEEEKIIITINDIKNINLICESETADLLLKFRNILWNVVDYIIKYEGTDENNLKSVKLFKDHLMVLILKILKESSRDIDVFKENEDIIE
ncbi:ATP-dependent RNA helicase DHX30-like [Apis laboriosa]|uniref:ATP-dependent RNA helicase DHX30-like n=1 Tax=Apis laboriosa TaxID=183418 RepID=UPI001CC5D80D|nr:ATP-dependent RNA helicase DHX30-like [Apis laboriosa]